MYKKQIVVTIITILITIGVVSSVLYLYSQMAVREAKVKNAKVQLVTYEQNKKVLVEENAQLEKINERTKLLEGYKVSFDHVPQLLSSLEGLASQKKVSFEISTVDTPKEGEVGKPITISFTAGGLYDAIESFLNTLLRQSYEARITQLRFFKSQATDAGKTGDHPAWEATASIEVLSF